MFELNEEITKWRSGLAESEKFSKADIDELETHLREEIESLTPTGLSQREAFVVAKGRLGDTASLENEFAKVNGGYMFRNRLFWMTAGACACLMAAFSAEAFGYAGALLAGQAGFRGYGGAAVGIAGSMLGWGVILLLACLACKPDSKLLKLGRFTGNRRGRIVLFVSFVVMVFALVGAAGLCKALIVRTMRPDYMRMAVVHCYYRLVSTHLMPIVLGVVLIKLRRLRYRAVCR